MATYTGRVKRSEFGGGWELHTDGGKVYELQGGGPFSEGEEVEVAGSVDEKAMSLSMRGPILKVSRSRKTG